MWHVAYIYIVGYIAAIISIYIPGGLLSLRRGVLHARPKVRSSGYGPLLFLWWARGAWGVGPFYYVPPLDLCPTSRGK